MQIENQEYESLEWIQIVVQAIENQAREYKYKEVEEIILDSLYIPHIDEQIKLFLEQFVNLRSLSFNRCQLETLINLPNLPLLIRLELNQNKFNQHELITLTQFKNLKSLVLRGNAHIDSFDVFSQLKLAGMNLIQLDVLNSNLASFPNYQQKLRKIFSDSLIYIDNFKKSETKTMIQQQFIDLTELQNVQEDNYDESENIDDFNKQSTDKSGNKQNEMKDNNNKNNNNQNLKINSEGQQSIKQSNNNNNISSEEGGRKKQVQKEMGMKPIKF